MEPRIHSEFTLVKAIKEYLEKGLNVSEITVAINNRGVVCYAVGIERLIKKHNLKVTK